MMKNKKVKLQIVAVILAAFLGGLFLIFRNWNFLFDIAFFRPPFVLPKFEVVIPQNTCNIKDYGAVSGGETKNTEAIAGAIEDCAKKGGGRVVVPDGVWLTGKIHLQSNIELHLEKNAKFVFSDDPQDYLPVVFTRFEGMELYNYSPFIYCANCENVALTGKGKLDGQGGGWANWEDRQEPAVKKLYSMATAEKPVSERVFGTEDDALRPSMVQFVNSKNISIKDISVLNSPMWTIHLLYSENIKISDVYVNTDSFNTDGIVVDSSRNIMIEESYLETGDDAVSIKSGLDADGWRVGRPSENVVVKFCQMKRAHSAVAMGSEMSEGVKNVYIWKNDFNNVDYGIRIKSLPGRGGYVENITVNDVEMNDIDTAIYLDMKYSAYTIKPATDDLPSVNNLIFSDISGTDTKNVVFVRGVVRDLLANLYFKGMDFSSESGIVVENAKNVEFDSIRVRPGKLRGKSPRSPLFSLINAGRVVIKNSHCPKEFDVCLKVEKGGSEDIFLGNNTPKDRWNNILGQKNEE